MSSSLELLRYILNQIVDNQDEVQISDESDDEVIRFNIQLGDSDYSRVIGRQGNTIKAITDLLRLHESKNNASHNSRIYLNVTAHQEV